MLFLLISSLNMGGADDLLLEELLVLLTSLLKGILEEVCV
jgi:hypothetical protein